MANFTRRSFLRHASSTVAFTAAASPILVRAEAKNDALHYAACGTGGKGFGDLMECSRGKNVRVAALCDVDRRRLGNAHQRFKDAKAFTDFREMLETVDIEAMTVSTPDHMHAPISLTAMHKGIHIYCQKPLTHNVAEARVMANIAAKNKLVTQMGIQGHSSTHAKLGRAIFRDGAIGKAKELHLWTNRPIWPQGLDRPAGSDPVPDYLDWNLWLGVAPGRPYKHEVYCPFKWRGWWDFGTGALGDIGCHALDDVAASMNLGPPKWVKYEGKKPNDETYPKASIVRYMFEGNEMSAGDELPMTWYDGGHKPPREVIQLDEDVEIPSGGVLIVGEKGTLLFARGRPRLSPSKNFKDYNYPKVKPDNHYTQFTDACQGFTKTSTPFSYSGPLTETILLGNIALRFPGKQLQWNSRTMTFPNVSEADRYVRRNYRAGWEVKGLEQRT